MTAPGRDRKAWWLGAVAILMLASLALAMDRVYQVDEAQTVYMAAVRAQGWTRTLFAGDQLHLYPLSLLARAGGNSAHLFMVFRFAFWVLFWVNAVLLVAAAGLKLRSAAGLKALVLAGTLSPWWAYGLECRHDNILLAGVLCLWLLARRLPAQPGPRFLGLGFLCLLLQACVFKAAATWVPLMAVVLFLEPGAWGARGKLACWFLLGAAAGLGFAWGVRALGAPGGPAPVQGAVAMSFAVERVSPLPTLHRLLRTSPLLLALMVGLLLRGAQGVRRLGLRGAWTGFPAFPETLLFLACLFGFLVNPNPFPYNLAVLSAGALVALLVLAAPWLEPGALKGAAALPFAVAFGLVLHATPWLLRVSQLFAMTNDRQEDLMTMAENATAPGDTVFDGIGMVPTRRAPCATWIVNVTNFQQFAKNPLTATWGDQMPPVILPSYRLNYLPPADMAFITTNFVPLRKDFWVLGAAPMTTAEPESWTCLKTGRYAVIPVKGGEAALTLDGKVLPAGFHELAKGAHTLAMDPARPCLLAWVGPRTTALPRPGTDGLDSLCPPPGAF